MMETSSQTPLRWFKALLNGLLALILGFALYMIPSLVVAFRMGFELGQGGVESAEIGRQISQHISSLYRESLWLHIGYTVVVGLLIFWRARVVAKGTGKNRIPHGLLVSSVAVVVTVLSAILTQVELSSVINLVVFCMAGYVGGRSSPETMA